MPKKEARMNRYTYSEIRFINAVITFMLKTFYCNYSRGEQAGGIN